MIDNEEKTDHNQLCKEFTELTGGHWHEWRIHYTPNGSKFYCRCHSDIYLEAMELPDNPTYDNAAGVLMVMMKRDDWKEFLLEIGGVDRDWMFDNTGDQITILYIIEPDALLKAAVEFLKEEKLGSP